MEQTFVLAQWWAWMAVLLLALVALTWAWLLLERLWRSVSWWREWGWASASLSAPVLILVLLSPDPGLLVLVVGVLWLLSAWVAVGVARSSRRLLAWPWQAKP